jgi:hypothetical protein
MMSFAVARTRPKPSSIRTARLRLAALCEPLESRRLLSATTVYVDRSATGLGNGSSWANAYTDLQPALTTAVSGETIDVAQGTYKPTTGTDQTASFQLLDGVAIYGGFAGNSTSTPGVRNLTAYPTILSGDIGLPNDIIDNSYHVVSANGINSTAILDGVTIADGNASIEDDGTTNVGGGMYNYDSSPTLANCTFSENTSSQGGGGMANDFSSPTLIGCIFSGNSASGPGQGGGMRNDGSSPTLINCAFSGNTAAFGGGMWNDGSSTSPATPALINCTLSGNTAENGVGGAIYNAAASPTLTNCILREDSADGDSEINNIDGGSASVTYSDVQGGYAGTGNINADPLFVNASAGDLELQAGSPAIGVGNPAAVPAGVTTDLAGNPRSFNGKVDMGAYEYGVDTAATFTSADATTFTAHTLGTFTIATAGFPVATLTVAGGFPSGVTFTDNGNGTATLAGTPAKGTKGRYTLTLKAKNGVAPRAKQTFTLTIGKAPTFTSAGAATFRVGAAGSFTITATGFPLAVLSESGTLPIGITLQDDGDGTAILTGTPAKGTRGVYVLTLKAKNGAKPNAKQTFTLTIARN